MVALNILGFKSYSGNRIGWITAEIPPDPPRWREDHATRGATKGIQSQI